MSRTHQRIFVSEQNGLLSLPPITPPLTSPFPIQLTNGGTVNLAIINLSNTDNCIKHNNNGVLLSAVINWSATFTPPPSISTSSILTTAGYANVTFEFLTNGSVVYRVTQTAVQKGIPLNQPTVLFTTAVPTYEIASMLFSDPARCHRTEANVYMLRATNILLAAPLIVTGGATTTAAVGAVTFVVSIL